MNDDDFREQLLATLHEEAGEPVTLGPGFVAGAGRRATQRRRRRIALATTGVLAGAALVGGGFAVWGRGTPKPHPIPIPVASEPVDPVVRDLRAVATLMERDFAGPGYKERPGTVDFVHRTLQISWHDLLIGISVAPDQTMTDLQQELPASDKIRTSGGGIIAYKALNADAIEAGLLTSNGTFVDIFIGRNLHSDSLPKLPDLVSALREVEPSL